MKRYYKIIFILLIFLVFIILSKTKNNTYIITSENNNFDYKDILAIMVETGINTSDYKINSSEEIPEFGYSFNKEKSECENGGLVLYDNITKKITYKSNTSDKCYVFFDALLSGDGTVESPYEISYIEQLIYLQEQTENGNNLYNKNFILTKTLDFKEDDSYMNANTLKYQDYNENGVVETLKTELTTGKGFKPIGANTSSYFAGDFNGKSFKIKNLYISNDVPELYRGLFGYVKFNTISNLEITGSVYSSVNAYLGGFTGASFNSTFTNCTNSVNVISDGDAYGIGGIVGASGKTTFNNIINIGTISGSNNAGGIVGYLVEEDSYINNSYNIGTINQTLGQNVGGLVGRTSQSSYLTINNSYNNGNINQNKTIGGCVGGLIGNIYGTVTINNSYNTGNVTSTPTIITGDVSLGGIIGYINSNAPSVILNNTYNTADITGGNRTGGIIGYSVSADKVILNKVHNEGTIYNAVSHNENTSAAGGLMAYNYGSKVYIIDSYNSNNVTSKIVASGIVGYTNYGGSTYVINSYNQAPITSLTGAKTAGISILLGYGSDLTNTIYINNSYNIGNASYGIIGILEENNCKITNSYTLQSLTSSNVSITGVTKYLEDEIKSQSFVNTLNTNKNAINLSTIDSRISDYELVNWKLVNNSYPTLEFN